MAVEKATFTRVTVLDLNPGDLIRSQGMLLEVLPGGRRFTVPATPLKPETQEVAAHRCRIIEGAEVAGGLAEVIDGVPHWTVQGNHRAYVLRADV